jgi:hypothetical protein
MKFDNRTDDARLVSGEAAERLASSVIVPESALPEWDCVAPCKGYALSGYCVSTPAERPARGVKGWWAGLGTM